MLPPSSRWYTTNPLPESIWKTSSIPVPSSPGIHMESVEPGLVHTFLDLMQLRVVVAQIGDERVKGSPAGNRRRAPRLGHDLQQPLPREQEMRYDSFGFGGIECGFGQQSTDVGWSVAQIKRPDRGADRVQLVVDGFQTCPARCGYPRIPGIAPGRKPSNCCLVGQDTFATGGE